MKGLPEWKYASDKQIAYIKRMKAEAFSRLINFDYDPLPNNGRRMLKDEASKRIEMCRRCLGK